jgi:hypothetical protein
MDNRNRQVYAADWFMRAAAMPCSLILVWALCGEPPDSATAFLLYFLVLLVGPVVIAGGWGAALGAAILDPEETRSPGRAALKGLAVTGASFVTYLFVICFWLTGVGGDSGGVFMMFLLVLIGGTILAGWLLAPVGALAGALLYKKQENLGARRVTPDC